MSKTIGYGEATITNMAEPFTVMLTNEAQQFATDSNRKVTSAQSYYTDIIVIRGSQERTDYTIGNITSGSGITVSKSSKRVTFSVSAGTTIGADAGVIEIPIILDGQTVKKQFSWSCGKQGIQGVKGEDGSNFAWNLLKGTGTAKEFTPKGNLTNQITLFNKLDLSGQTLKEGDKFVISCDLEWTKFAQGTSGTFGYRFQGSVDYSWSYDNIFAQGLQKVQPTKAEILASDGKKHLSAVCTMTQSLLDKKIFEIGIRFDYSDGTGKVKISNLKIAKEDKESPWCLHPDELKGETGDKGKSVQNVIEYYLATSASTGVITSTSGWSTDPTTQKLTAEKKYLWNCKQTVYDDGTKGSITSPVICGTYGDKGNDGKTSYVHAAYANITYLCGEHHSFTLTEDTLVRYGTRGKWIYKTFSAGTYSATTSVFGSDPYVGLGKEVDKITDFSTTDTTNRLYTGQYSDFSETASTDPSRYNWAKTTGDNGISPKVSLSKSGDTTTISIVDATGTHTQTVKDGTNGTPGATGKDGKTSYFHVKYSNDGGKTFTGNSGEDTGIYMGSYTDYAEADSTDVSKYTWVKVAGDNFSWNPLIGSSFLYSALPNNVNFSVVSVNNIASTVFTIEGLHYKATASNGAANSSRGVKVNSSVLDLKVGDTIALSCDIKGSFGTINNGLCVMHATTTNDAFYAVVSNGGSTIHPTSITDWTRKSRTYTIPSNIKIESDGSFYLYFFFGGGTGSEVDVYVRNVQIEKGNVATPWTPNPDDLIGEKGQDGTNGTSVTVSKTEVTYQVSTSGTTAPTGTWSTTMPTCDQGLYLWTKTYVKYSDGKDTTSYAVSYKGVDGKKFAFNMLRGTNQGSKHWETHYDSSVDGKYSVESFVDEDGTNGVKFICTEKTSRWQYVCFIDYEMIKTLKSATKYVFSCDIKTNVENGYIKTSLCTGSASNHFADNLATKLKGDNTWEHVVWSFTTYDSLPQVNNQIVYLSSTAVANVGETYIKNLKLTEGTVDTPWAPHPEDLEGRGVSETVQYYLAISQPSGVTSSTSGWSTDITTQKITADKKYLWNCYQTKYSDGTSEPISTPKVIGVYGDKGIDGQDGEDGAGFHWNLLKYSGDLSQMSYGKVGGYIDTQEFISDASAPSKNVLKSTITTVGSGIYIQGKYLKEGTIKKGNTYTVSAWCKCSSVKDIGVMNVEFLDNKVNISMPKLSTEWQQYIITGVANKDVTTTSGGSAISFYYGNKMAVGDIFYISSPKVEEGDKASPWCTTYEETLAKNISITPSAQYFKSTDGGKTFAPNTITIKPTIQGEISFGKWQYSIDGGVSFADVVNGQKGLTISNNVLTVSKDSSLYSDAVTMVTFRAVANDSSFYDTCSIAKIYDVSDIGDGRNLIQKSQIIQNGGITLNLDDYSKNGTVIFNTTGTSDGFRFDSYNNYQPNSKYVLSYYFTKTSGTMDHFGGFHNGKGVTYTSYFVDDKAYSGGSYVGESSQIGALLNDGKRHRIVVCYTTPSTILADTNVSYTYIQPGRGNTNPNFGVKIEELKLEKGSSPTGWSPAPEDLQTAILSTKSEISSVSSKVDQNTKSIQNKVENTTYQNDLKLVKGDIAKSNEGLNKWRYEIYPKSLFATDDQSKSTMDVFAKNKNLVPSRTVLLDDTDLGKTWGYGDNYIGYALTFVKFSTAKSVAITFKHDDGAHLYLNGKLIGGSDGCNTGSGHNLSLSFVKGWNCLEVVLNEVTGGEYIGFGTTVSTLTECELMNCYYAMVTGRESQITNTLVQTVTDLSGVTTTVGKVTGAIGEDGGKFTEFKNDYSNFKQSMDGFKTTVSSTYVTKNDFDNLEIGGRNLLLYSQDPKGHTDYYHSLGYISLESEIFGGSPVWSTKSQWGRLGWNFKNHVIDRGFVNVGDTFTYSLYVKTNNTDGKNISCSYRFQGNSGAKWFDGSTTTVTTSWRQISATFSITEAMLDSTAYLNQIGFEVTSSMSSDDKVYFACPKLEKGNKPTGWTPAPEDVDGQITTVESETKQLADRFSWIVKSGTSASNMTLTDRMLDVIAQNINLTGKVTFSSFDKSAQDKINGIDQKAGNAATAASKAQASANNAKAAADKAQSSVDDLQIGGRNLLVQRNITQGYLSTDGKGSFIGTDGGDQTTDWIDVSGNKYITITLYENFTNTNNSGRYCEYDADKNCINTVDYNPRSKSSIIIELKTNTKYIRVTAIECKTRRYKIEVGNKATDWTPAPEDISQDATTKASQALTDAKNYSSSAVNWVTNNGSSTTSLNSMVKKWTDGAVSDTAHINGGWIEANTITVSKIAVSDFTNYCQLDKDSAPSYGFTATDDEDGIWYTADPIKRDKEISQWFTCEDSQKLYVEYDISTTVQGKVNSSDTDNSYLHSGIMIFAADGNKKAISYIRTKDATAAADGIVTHVSVTETLPTGARFFKVVLQTNGQNGSFSGVLKIRNLQVRKATTGKLIVDGAITADKINVSDLFAKNITASGTIQSKNYAESSGVATAGSKWILSDGSFKSKNLSWDASGNIVAAGGKIGKYTITDSYLITGSGATASGFGGNQAFWAGSSSSNDAPFRVGYNGQLVASGATLTNATVSGDITATTGQIGELVLQDGMLTGSGQIVENKTDGSGNITSTTTTDYITKFSKKGLNIESVITSSDSDIKTNCGTSVCPEYIGISNGKLMNWIKPNGLSILGSDTSTISINTLASTFYYSDEGYRTRLGIDYQGILLMCEDGNKTFKINVSGADGMDISGANVRLQNNITASRFVFYKDSFNYIESLEANNTNNIYFHSNGYYSFRVNNEGNWSDETQSVYITERGISVPGQIGLYSQEMSNYVARYYVAGSTKSTAIGNNNYQTRIYGSSVWANKAVSTSDVRLKQDFQSLDKFEDLYMQLQPVSFKYIDGYDKSEDRYFGLKAQPTEKLFEDMGENPDDYAMFNKFGIDHEDIKERIGHDVDFDEEHGLDYTNMIALNTHMVQKTRRELAKLEAENAELKASLKAIMKKLNM